MRLKRLALFTVFSLFLSAGVFAAHPCRVVYEGKGGPGHGKHIVMIAGDHEYRLEETLPALARILAKHHGFKCSVFFTTDPDTGAIDPGSSHISGLEALKTADLMVVGLRFRDFTKEQMQHFVDYLDAGGPVIGLRTSTHAFKIPEDKPFAKYSFKNPGEDFKGGFGRQILGETWAGHYGKNHVQSTIIDLLPGMADHPILRGVKDPWVQAGGYFADPIEGSKILAMSQPLNGMTPDSPRDENKKAVPGAWIRTYTSASGKSGRVFTSTYGASEDILNEGFRRMLVNACFWTVGLEEAIKPSAEVEFVGPYNPVTFRNGGHRQGVKPANLSGWDSPIMPESAPVSQPKKKEPKKAKGK